MFFYKKIFLTLKFSKKSVCSTFSLRVMKKFVILQVISFVHEKN